MGPKKTEKPKRCSSDLKPLCLAKSLDDLNVLVQEDETIKTIKSVDKLRPIISKLKREIFNQCYDQEKCFLLCKRYLAMLDLLYKKHEDPNFIHCLYSSDGKQVEALLDDLIPSLQARYAAAALKYDPPEDPLQYTSRKDMPCIQKITRRNSSLRKIFGSKFVEPRDLYRAFEEGFNILVLDVRPKKDFEKYRIKHVGDTINISPSVSTSGLSANILGQKLNTAYQLIWKKRDTYDAIVLVDNETMKYDFNASKLRFIRTALVEWDFNTQYMQKPVVLDGGLKTYVDWYPTQVTNVSLYLLENCNKEIDELLEIDDIEYPEPGSTSGPGNVKVYSMNSTGELESSATDDSVLTEEEDNLLKSTSEGNLPLGVYPSEDYLLAPIGRVSDPILHKDFISSPRDSISEEEIGTTIGSSNDDLIISSDIKQLIQGDKEDILKHARSLKPKLQSLHSSVTDTEQIEYSITDVPVDPSEVEPSPERTEVQPIDSVTRPEIDRTQKPMIQRLLEVECPGEGFTGLRNIKNNCYMNAMMQSLKVIPVLKSMYVTTNGFLLQTIKKPAKINYEFGAAMQDLWKGTRTNKRVSSLHEFRSKMVILCPIYGRGNHEDTFEFFTGVFSLISEDCEYQIEKPRVLTDSQRSWIGNLGGNSSFYNDLFFHQLRNRKVCQKCNKTYFSYDVDSTVMLPVLGDTVGVLRLQHLIDDYLREGQIWDFACTNCKTFHSLIHYKEVFLAPDVLVIVLKRYKSTPDRKLVKINAPIIFPKEDLEFGTTKYKLYAIPQHVGTMNRGHYVTTVLLDDKKDEWYKFNDDEITQVDSNIEANITLQQGCVGFFYVKQSL